MVLSASIGRKLQGLTAGWGGEGRGGANWLPAWWPLAAIGGPGWADEVGRAGRCDVIRCTVV